MKVSGKRGIYVGTTVDELTGLYSYGGRIITKKGWSVRYDKVVPSQSPQPCNVANANILLVSNNVVEKVGIFDNTYTHGIADYDYTYTAFKKGFPVWVAPGICGYCEDDHGSNWKSASTKFKDRLTYLRSPKGLAYKEYLYYIKKHFPIFLPYSFAMLWGKTLFPAIWEKFKGGNS
jgi:GT2 family glycosyltransferase